MPKSRGAERATNGTNSTSPHWVTNIRRLRNLPTSEGCRAAEVMSGKATGINLIGNHAREIVRSSRQYAVSPPSVPPEFSANAAIRLSCLPATRRRMELGAQSVRSGLRQAAGAQPVHAGAVRQPERQAEGSPEQGGGAGPPGEPAAVDHPRRGLSRRSGQRRQAPGDDPDGAGSRAVAGRKRCEGKPARPAIVHDTDHLDRAGAEEGARVRARGRHHP